MGAYDGPMMDMIDFFNLDNGTDYHFLKVINMGPTTLVSTPPIPSHLPNASTARSKEPNLPSIGTQG